tara:strand:- start:1075 stop:3855 length:2781 start_codon:yes stop_codon:yes gene_type:complete
MYKTYLFSIIVFLGFLKTQAQEFPPINIYYPQDYKAENQNWDISQAENKYIYVANNKGLLEFDGSNWTLYNSPNQTIQRSVNVIDSKIYAGYYMQFGYWEKDDLGLLNYTSLSSKVNMIEDEQIWTISNLKNFILFQSLNRIYIYNTLNNSFSIVNSKETILKMFKVDNDVYFQKNGLGLFKLVNGKQELISGLFKDDRIVKIFNLNNELVLITENKGFYKYKNLEWEPWDTDLELLPETNSVYSALKLSNNNLLLGTISDGIIVINDSGQLVYTINQTKGLSNNTVLSLFEDAEKNLWLGLDRGINSIKFSSPYKIFTDYKGDLGTVYSSIVYKGNLYLGTNQGLFWRALNETKAFQLINTTEGQVWCLREIDNTLFCGHNNGTFIVKGDKVAKVADIQGSWDFKAFNNSTIIQGNYNGFSVLKKTDNNWNFSHYINGFNVSSRFFEIEDMSIFINHEYKGLYQLQLDPEVKNVTSVKSFEKIFKKGSSSSLAKFRNTIYYANTNGIYSFSQSNFLKDKTLSNIYSSQNYISGKLVSTDSYLWAFTKEHILALEPSNLSNEFSISKIPLKNSLRESMTGFENVSQINKSTYLFGTSFGYINLNLSAINKNKDKNVELYLNKVEVANINGTYKPVSLYKNNEFKAKENNIKIAFSVPYFGKYEQVEYSYVLDGFESNWSDWGLENTQSFKNLPFGEYTFKVKAKIGLQETPIKEFAFTIGKPWYLTNLMIAIYVLALILFSILMHILYTTYFKRKQEIALLQAKKEISFKKLENEQQLTAFKNEKLQQDIESKNRELAISTMSIIKKNEFLNTIKKELIEKNNESSLDKVIKLLDKNINNSKDWEFFQEAFNNADKNFFNKIKEIHPILTPTDLKLCAYLRLNLSSKEIAPLLNISPKSVEVKRYRLRKKMDLDHEASLTNYILEI